MTPHGLRHTAATRLLRSGRNTREVQALLWHANLSTTEVYTHVNADDLREALDALSPVNGTEEPEQDAPAVDLLAALEALSPEQR